MKKVTKIIAENKNISILVIVGFIITTIGISYAFFSDTAQIDTPSTQEGTIISDEEAKLTINKTMSDLIKVAGTDYSKFTVNAGVTLMAPEQHDTVYNLNIQINENKYSGSSESSAKVLLKIINPLGNEVTSYNGLTRKTVGAITGFDLTDYEEIIKAGNDYNISTSKEITQNWTLEFYLYDKDGTSAFEVEILLNEGSLSKLITSDNGGIKVIEEKLEPDFSQISATNEGMFAAEDNYGTSYYYRGAVDNNWLVFAGFYWRIIRINGDQSVKIIYSGIEAPIESEKVTYTSADSGIGTSQFNGYASILEYGGYNYTVGVEKGNSTNSIISSTINNWYQVNLGAYDSYIADTTYCSGRTIYTDINGTTQTSGIGSSAINKYYESYINVVTNKNPLLTCLDTKDYYSVDIENSNKSLENKIFLITPEEVMLAGGGINIPNSNYYLYSGLNTWMASSAHYDLNGIRNFAIGSDGHLGNTHVNNSFLIRPVTSLNGDIKMTGTGNWNDPYKLN